MALELSLQNFASFIEILTVANFTFAFTDILTLKVVHTVVRVPERLNRKILAEMYDLLNRHPELVTFEGGKHVRGLGIDMPAELQTNLDCKCAEYEHCERSWCFAMGFYGLILLLVNGFTSDPSAEAIAVLSWLNSICILGSIAIYLLSHKFETSEVISAYKDRAKEQLPVLFSRITITWVFVGLSLFILLTIGLDISIFKFKLADHLTIIISMILLSFPFIRHFAIRHTKTGNLNKMARKPFEDELRRLKTVAAGLNHN